MAWRRRDERPASSLVCAASARAFATISCGVEDGSGRRSATSYLGRNNADNPGNPAAGDSAELEGARGWAAHLDPDRGALGPISSIYDGPIGALDGSERVVHHLRRLHLLLEELVEVAEGILAFAQQRVRCRGRQAALAGREHRDRGASPMCRRLRAMRARAALRLGRPRAALCGPARLRSWRELPNLGGRASGVRATAVAPQWTFGSLVLADSSYGSTLAARRAHPTPAPSPCASR